MAQALSLEVVAEGVETERQADELRKLGCELAQGFLFHGPLDAERVGALVAAGGNGIRRTRSPQARHQLARAPGATDARRRA
jgi:predicted signal transduction protein with EAL and GGDEF domain